MRRRPLWRGRGREALDAIAQGINDFVDRMLYFPARAHRRREEEVG